MGPEFFGLLVATHRLQFSAGWYYKWATVVLTLFSLKYSILKMKPGMIHIKTMLIRGYCTPSLDLILPAPLDLVFEDFCVFYPKIKKLSTKYPMDLIKNVPRNSKISFFFQLRQWL